jgi:hypothetical protein
MTKLQVLLAALLLTLTACATRKYMLSKPLDSGVKATYAATFDKVKRAAYDSLGDLNYGVKDEIWDNRDPNAFVINASQGLSTGSTGKYARIVIMKADSEQTVYIYVESKAATRSSAASDEDDAKNIHSRIEKRVTAK